MTKQGNPKHHSSSPSGAGAEVIPFTGRHMSQEGVRAAQEHLGEVAVSKDDAARVLGPVISLELYRRQLLEQSAGAVEAAGSIALAAADENARTASEPLANALGQMATGEAA